MGSQDIRRAHILPSAPIGYQYEYRLVADAKEQEIVDIILLGRAAAQSLRSIARALNARGYRNRRGAQFNTSSIRNIILSRGADPYPS